MAINDNELSMPWLDIKNFKREPIHFILPGFVEGTVGALISPGGYGKSMLAMEIAVSVAVGEMLPDLEDAFHNWEFEKPIKVAYLVTEDPEAIIIDRLDMIKRHLPEHLHRKLDKNLRIAALQKYNASLQDPKWLARFNHVATESKLIIIDTFRRIHTADENDGSAMSVLLKNLEQICISKKCNFLLLHHTNKLSVLNNGDMAQASRGSSVLSDNIRYQLNLSMPTQKDKKQLDLTKAVTNRTVKLTVSKINYGPKQEDVLLFRSHEGFLSTSISALSADEDINQVRYQKEKRYHEEESHQIPGSPRLIPDLDKFYKDFESGKFLEDE